MKSRFSKYQMMLFAGLILFGWNCERSQQGVPDIQIEIEPASGLTTTVFSFDLSKTFSMIQNDRLFIRWDWNGDSIYDTPFLHEPVFHHRYYEPGKYTPGMEIRNLNGDTKEAAYSIQVDQGYSAPRAAFTITPDTGHILTDFVFDASVTQDDEDSLSTLLFSWDFEDDGYWDRVGEQMLVSHRFNVPGFYTVVLSVKDPSGRSAKTETVLWVTLTDPCIVADYEIHPKLIIQNEDVLFDASPTHNNCQVEETYHYRWDFNNDRIFDTEWSSDPTVIHSFPLERYYFVRLEVKSSSGLVNGITKRFWIFHQNQAPQARFSLSTYGGNTHTNFRFDAWSCKDYEDAPSQMLTRWDFDGDGIWDTDYSTEKVIFHTYDQPGVYKAALELVDRGELKDTAYQTVFVSDSPYQTDLLLDKRGYYWNYYGTVKIGDQWWFSKNLAVDGQSYNNSPYLGSGVNIPFYGFLYTYNYLPIVCPDGWRVPDKQDWDRLFDNLETEDHYQELILGGKTGFNAVFGGFNESGLHNSGQGIGNFGHYWSATKLIVPGGLSAWGITFVRSEENIIKGWNNKGYYFSVRCMRDE